MEAVSSKKGHLVNSITEQYTKGNGKALIDKATGSRSGQMVLDTKEIGLITWLKVKANFTMQMVMFTMVIGSRTRRKERENIATKMGLYSMAAGQKIISTVLEGKNGLIRVTMKVAINMEQSMGRGSMSGLIIVATKGIGMKTKFKAKEPTSGLMEELILENGLRM